MMNKTFYGYCFAIGFGLLSCCGDASSAPVSEQHQLLQLKQQHVQLKLALSRLERTRLLFQRGGTGQIEVTQAQADADLAQIAFQQVMLQLLNAQPKLAVEKAVRMRDASGQQFLQLKIRNVTLILDASQQQLLQSFSAQSELPELLLERNLENIFVSIRDISMPNTADGMYALGQNSVVIALPYEQKIERLAYDEVRELRFKMLSDLARISVHFSYRGIEQSLAVFTEQEFSGSNLELLAGQIIQEADLGTHVDYPFELRRNGQDTRTFQLALYQLPVGIRYSFIEPISKTKVSQLRLSTGEQYKKLMLRLELPQKSLQGFVLDQPVAFQLVAYDVTQQPLLQSLSSSPTLEQLRQLPIAITELSLISRGAGLLQLDVAALQHQIEVGGEGRFDFFVKNQGSSLVNNISFSAERPSGWDLSFSPASISQLEVGQEQKVNVLIRNRNAATEGDYEFRLKTEAFTANRPLVVEDKLVRVQVQTDVRVLPLLLMLMAFLLAAVLILYVGRKARIR
jgi:hypothetical protein